MSNGPDVESAAPGSALANHSGRQLTNHAMGIVHQHQSDISPTLTFSPESANWNGQHTRRPTKPQQRNLMPCFPIRGHRRRANPCFVRAKSEPKAEIVEQSIEQLQRMGMQRVNVPLSWNENHLSIRGTVERLGTSRPEEPISEPSE
jgi:hypothetical protein